MIVAVADTHTVLWYLFSDPRLSKAASSFIDQTIASGDQIGLSAISIAEMVYLIEKGRISPNSLNDLQTALLDSRAVLRHIPLDERIALKMVEVSRAEIPDLPDRVIAATAYVYGVPGISRDRRIRSSTIQAIW
jgi:PIN domain nuclease of toxin-antitoxin system